MRSGTREPPTRRTKPALPMLHHHSHHTINAEEITMPFEAVTTHDVSRARFLLEQVAYALLG